MENTDSYLHKKFKKQVNIDSKVQIDKETKIVIYMETNEEKTDKKQNHNLIENHHSYENQRFDNKDSVPNQSTNSSSLTLNTNFVMSSISLGIQQSSNSCISYVVSKQFDQQAASFDTKFKPQTNSTSTDSTSSILDTVYLYPTQNKLSSRSEEISGLKPQKPYVPDPPRDDFSSRNEETPPTPTRLMGTRSQEFNNDDDGTNTNVYSPNNLDSKEEQQKPYKPRFHSTNVFDNVASESTDEEPVNQNSTSEFVTHQINEIIHRNNLKVTSSNRLLQKEVPQLEFGGCKEPTYEGTVDEPLNLTNKNRKRSMSEVSEPVIQKSLIKELLLKILSSSDMQCPYCKMIFRTVTELDVHKYRSCKGKSSGAKYSRSSSVNVAFHSNL